jgi:hypothetical protein
MIETQCAIAGCHGSVVARLERPARRGGGALHTCRRCADELQSLRWVEVAAELTAL